MKKKLSLTVGSVLTLMLLLSAHGLYAESDEDSTDLYNYILILGMTQEPDPISAASWDQLSLEAPALNSGGALREDGAPHIVVDATPTGPAVVWAYNAGTDFDIALSTWDGQAWTPIEFLTSSTYNEIDPHLCLDEKGNLHVVYWVQETEEIYLTSLDATGGQWSLPQLITSNGRSPSIVFEGTVQMVAYDRRAPGGQEVVIHTQSDAGETTIDVIATTSYSEPLNVLLHSQGGRIWLDWIHNENYLGYTHYLDGVWGVSANSVAWLNYPWIGITNEIRSASFDIVGGK